MYVIAALIYFVFIVFILKLLRFLLVQPFLFVKWAIKKLRGKMK